MIVDLQGGDRWHRCEAINELGFVCFFSCRRDNFRNISTRSPTSPSYCTRPIFAKPSKNPPTPTPCSPSSANTGKSNLIHCRRRREESLKIFSLRLVTSSPTVFHFLSVSIRVHLWLNFSRHEQSHSPCEPRFAGLAVGAGRAAVSE